MEPIDNAMTSSPVTNQEIIMVSMVPTIRQLIALTMLRIGRSDFMSASKPLSAVALDEVKI
jgi:hypothetical protein